MVSWYTELQQDLLEKEHEELEQYRAMLELECMVVVVLDEVEGYCVFHNLHYLWVGVEDMVVDCHNHLVVLHEKVMNYWIRLPHKLLE